MSTKILGYEWEQIQRAQQGDNTALRGHIIRQDTPEEMKAKLESEMERFGLFVHKDVAEAYKVTIPANYTLDGDHYKPRTTRPCTLCNTPTPINQLQDITTAGDWHTACPNCAAKFTD